MMRLHILIITLAFMVLSCAQKQTKVVLLPQDDGGTGGVIMQTQDRSVSLDKPYTVSQSGTMEVIQADPEAIKKEYGSLLNMELKRPPKPSVKKEDPWPKQFTLYFEGKTTTLTGESQAILPEVFALLSTLPPTRIHVLGFTDTIGDRSMNLTLSLSRAKTIAQLLAQQDGQSNQMEIGGYGEYHFTEPLPDNTPDPMRRKVTIYIYPGR